MNRVAGTITLRRIVGLLALLVVAAATLSISGAGAQPAISVAVLPFINASGDPNQEAIADGLTEEIAAALANVPGSNVGARSSAFRFKAIPRNLRAIGESLNKSHLVEGSWRKMEDRIRVSARLVRAVDGMQLWSEDYDRAFPDIFDVQDEIA